MLAWTTQASAQAPAENQAVAENANASALTFEGQVRPILKAHCFPCHGEGDVRQANLDLRLRRWILKGGDSGSALVEGFSQQSLLWLRVSRGEMPPGEKKKLSRAELATIATWLDAGAPTARPEPENVDPNQPFTPEEQSFWSFQPPRAVEPPSVAARDRVRTPIDAFLLARLESGGLSFSPDAEKKTLLRRATFDLLGLLPTPEEIVDFLADESPDAYERLIDRLLSSPHYGERWGRHWLDVAGYADSDGYTEEDPVRAWAYKYRDYVIRAFNQDKPLDEFIVEQLAGDELLPNPQAELSPDQIEKLVATGFLRMGPDGTGASTADPILARNDVLAETLKIVSTSLLGLTVGCAQCHDHRYDPISQVDYYRWRAIFEPAYDCQNWRPPASRLVSLYTADNRAQAARIEEQAAVIDQERQQKLDAHIARVLESELAKLPEELRETVRAARATPSADRTEEQKRLLAEHPSVNVDAGSLYLYDPKAAEELKGYADKAKAVRDTKPVEEFVQALTEVPGTIPTTFLFARGDYRQPKQEVAPGELAILATARPASIAADDPNLSTSGRRLAFARQLTDGAHPLLARVLVNRVWLHHFGKGIVGTPGNFGALGERPTHPELLDWLARDLVANDWRLKRLHKLIMTSTAYRQASTRQSVLENADPDNRLYGRKSLLRLDAESVRDNLLAIAGRLNCKMFGPSVPVMVDEIGQIVLGIENLDGNVLPGTVLPMQGEDLRRSVYVQARRSRMLGALETFDRPTMDPNCELRGATTVAPQSLMMMNSDFVIAQSIAMAERVVRETSSEPSPQIVRAWQLAQGDTPTETELAEALAFLAAQTEQFRALPPPMDQAAGATALAPEVRALASLCQALVSSNRFLYVD